MYGSFPGGPASLAVAVGARAQPGLPPRLLRGRGQGPARGQPHRTPTTTHHHLNHLHHHHHPHHTHTHTHTYTPRGLYARRQYGGEHSFSPNTGAHMETLAPTNTTCTIACLFFSSARVAQGIFCFFAAVMHTALVDRPPCVAFRLPFVCRAWAGELAVVVQRARGGAGEALRHAAARPPAAGGRGRDRDHRPLPEAGRQDQAGPQPATSHQPPASRNVPCVCDSVRVRPRPHPRPRVRACTRRFPGCFAAHIPHDPYLIVVQPT